MKLYLAAFFFCLLTSAPSQAQYRVILDTDIDSDVDDVEALAMLHTLADRQKIQLLGVIVTSDDPYAATCVDVINTHLGRPELPVGFLKNQPVLKNHSRYTRQLTEEFPHTLATHEAAPDATGLYRKLLSESPDASVVIVTVGHLTSLQNLLQSKGDGYSPLNGQELVRKKVARWLCMGGYFPEGKEANFYRPDPLSTVYCLQVWEKPVVFAGWEVGQPIVTGGEHLKKRLSPASPVYRAYELYNNFAGRASWDQVAVLLLMEESERYFATETQGYCHVNDDGSNRWVPGPQANKQHAYVKFRPGASSEEIARLMDDMVKK
ncbi:nucleoside hydrolase [Rhabdobacter roseus]|uniref:Inosine-uridine nucleoside N-ribohydrolase n=1 Tax=Rhabdobacter roseus TaxID=1655419 RepID=A0A840TK29_9BACT|nr:nucleoside hydrolase [Rhabdobacter roseus]MBB5283774.1 inosine-uridine nucleoside N-ribohydrolase [Rhabdobacter roseus]